MLPKDLLGLVFWELEYGHDMINFSEINRRCYQIFHQNLEVQGIANDMNDPIIYTRISKTKQKHGLYRDWYNKDTLFQEINFYYDQRHGQFQEWNTNGMLGTQSQYYHGKRHGRFLNWYRNGILATDITYYAGNPHGKYQTYYATGANQFTRHYHHGFLIKN